MWSLQWQLPENGVEVIQMMNYRCSLFSLKNHLLCWQVHDGHNFFDMLHVHQLLCPSDWSTLNFQIEAHLTLSTRVKHANSTNFLRISFTHIIKLYPLPLVRLDEFFWNQNVVNLFLLSLWHPTFEIKQRILKQRPWGQP